MANFYKDNEHLHFHLYHPLMEKIVKLKERNFSERDQYDFAALDHEDAMDSFEKVLEIIGEIAGDIIQPNAEGVDHDGPVLLNNEVKYAAGTQENHDALVKAGLVGISLPREYGGLNFPIVPYVMSAEIVSRADAGFANIWGLQDCAETIHEFASEEIKKEFLPRFNKGATAAMILTEPDAGSDLQSVQLKATYSQEKGVWYLNGVKRFITNGDADISLVLARTEEGTTDARGLSLFVYDRKVKAVNIRRIENKLGIKGSPTCEMVFSNAPAILIGDTRMGLIKYVMSLMNSARLGVGAQSVGIAEAAYREALKYAYEREQFGKPIIKYPAIYELLTMMQAKIYASRALLYETARYVDIYKAYNFISEERKLEPEERAELKYYSRLADVLTPLVKLFASEYCNQITYDAIQIHGGTGYMKDFTVERLYRDARITTIYEGTSQLQVVAAIRGVGNESYLKLMQEYASRPVHPELDHLKNTLLKMTDQFEKAASRVNESGEKEMLDFHARRLVEMAGNVIMGYLLLLDTERDRKYLPSAEVFIRKSRAENVASVSFINSFDPKDLGGYKRLSDYS
ncbi:MAG TPA: acyl-CoA dehydrogenase [Bacteroidales bacterium]|nr:acyl-CoA dehydrogenase [Bacteroidales bacterium]